MVDRDVKTPGFRPVTECATSYFMDRASEHGYSSTDHSWTNFGQGAPETGPLPGAPDRELKTSVFDGINEYAPLNGIPQLRDAVAQLYNERYRKGKQSQYTRANVAICAGGRSAIAQLLSSMGEINVGFCPPDFPPYEELLAMGTHTFAPIALAKGEERDFVLKRGQFKRHIQGLGLSAILMSNPCNPTGQLLEGTDLKDLVDVSRETRCTLLLDEFYSNYVYTHSIDNTEHRCVSAAEFVEDVELDPICLIDGATKGWRLPGWRLAWVLGPSDVIQAIGAMGVNINGGTNHPLQVAMLPMMSRQWADRDAASTQMHFRQKRDYVLQRLAKIGLPVQHPPKATFYVWIDLSPLPRHLQDGQVFFDEALKHKVIVLPGIYFDINPRRRRNLDESPYHHFIRLSFGPRMERLVAGLDALERMIADAKAKAAESEK